MRRIGWLVAPLVLVGLPATAAPAPSAVPPPVAVPVQQEHVRVPVRGGGHVEIPKAQLGRYAGHPGLVGERGPLDLPESGPVANEAATPRPSDDEAAQFPVDAPQDPGTITTVAGGGCEGYHALDATVNPVRMAYDRAGRLFWIESSQSSASMQFGGSPLIRTVDGSGRVRTLGPVLEPTEGRWYRQIQGYQTNLVPDGHGGVFLNRGPYFDPEPRHHDVPLAEDVVQVRADGSRLHVAGGKLMGELDWINPEHGDGDVATSTGLGNVTALAGDPASEYGGSLFLAEFGVVSRIRFVNRGTRPVTFHPGTVRAVTVQPGRIGTVWSKAPTNARLDDLGSQSFERISSIVVHGNVLYAWMLNNGGDWTAKARVVAINLGGEPVRVNGATVPAGEYATVAGDVSQPAGYSGDGGLARLARFKVSYHDIYGDIAVDDHGLIYIADTINHRIRMVDADGMIRTVAGVGVRGYDAAAPAALTRLANPLALAIDPQGRVAFADYGNSRIRRIDTDGVVRDIVGRGPTPCGLGHLAAGRSVYGGALSGAIESIVTDSRGRTYAADGPYRYVRRTARDGRVERVGVPTECAEMYPTQLVWMDSPCPLLGPRSGDGGPYRDARFAHPGAMALDAYDNLYVADVDRVRYVNFLTRDVSVHGVRVAAGTIATVWTFPDRMVTVTLPTGGTVQHSVPIGHLALDDTGGLYVGDPLLDVVLRIGHCGDVGVVAGTGVEPQRPGEGDGGPPLRASMNPGSLQFDPARRVLFVFDTSLRHSGRVRAMNFGTEAVRVFGRTLKPGTIDTVAGAGDCAPWCSSGDGGEAYRASVDSQGTIAFGWDGRLYLTEAHSGRIRVVLPDGRIAGLASPMPDAAPGTLWRSGGYLGDGGPALEAWFGFGHWVAGFYTEGQAYRGPGLHFDGRGGLLVGDTSGRVRRITHVTSAPLRLGKGLPAGHDAGVEFTRPLLLRGDDSGTTAPDLAVDGSDALVSASRGSGGGCELWRVTRDVASPVGDGPVSLPGGAACPVGAGGGTLAVGTPLSGENGAPQRFDGGTLVTTSADGGAHWTAAPSLAADRPAERAVGAPSVTVTKGGRPVAVHRTTGGDVAVSIGGAVGQPVVGRIPVAAAVVGDVVAGADGRLDVALLVPRSGTPETGWVMRVVVASSPDGSTWSTQDVAEVAFTGDAALARPSLARAATGELYVAWTDLKTVSLRWRAGVGWSRTVPVKTPALAALPTVAAGSRGRVAVAFYGTPMLRAGSVANPYASWYAYVARTTNVAATRPAWVSRPASAGPIFDGALCMESCAAPATDAVVVQTVFECAVGWSCPAEALARRVALGALGGPGLIRARVAPDGAVLLSYAVAPGRNGNLGSPTAAFSRSCAGVSMVAGRRPSGCAAAPSSRPVVELPPRPEAPPVPGLICSPLPPTRPAPEGPGTPPRADDPQEPEFYPEHPDRPPVAAVPMPLLPLVQPAFPPGQAPATSTQNVTQTETQTGTQSQFGVQAGVAPDSEEEAEMVTEYAASRREPEAAVPLMLAAAALTAAAAAVGMRTCPALARRTR